MVTSTPLGRRAAAFGFLAIAASGLAGCNTARETTGSTYPADYRERFPIVLTDAPTTMDLFVEGAAGLDARQRRDLGAFLGEYRRSGGGGLVAQVPVGVWNSAATQRALATVRAAAGSLSVARYQPADPTIASPIRLNFRRLQAKVAAQCGNWPHDVGAGDYVAGASNLPYWNLGCAYQSNFAAQIADPVDLVRGRQETPPDTQKRIHSFEQLRQGQDPSPTYKQDGANKINQAF